MRFILTIFLLLIYNICFGQFNFSHEEIQKINFTYQKFEKFEKIIKEYKNDSTAFYLIANLKKEKLNNFHIQKIQNEIILNYEKINLENKKIIKFQKRKIKILKFSNYIILISGGIIISIFIFK